jgi:hypothetical protein
MDGCAVSSKVLLIIIHLNPASQQTRSDRIASCILAWQNCAKTSTQFVACASSLNYTTIPLALTEDNKSQLCIAAAYSNDREGSCRHSSSPQLRTFSSLNVALGEIIRKVCKLLDSALDQCYVSQWKVCYGKRLYMTRRPPSLSIRPSNSSIAYCANP